jgi:hypothetical protein
MVLVGWGLLLAGALGLPAWGIQVIVSAAGAGSGQGPLPPWEMCALLGAAIPAGVLVLQLATWGLDPSLDRLEVPERPITESPSGTHSAPQLTSPVAPHRRVDAVMQVTSVRLHLDRIGAVQSQLLRHELRLRPASMDRHRRGRQRRGEH